jgi:hypothetical protein
VAVGDKHEKGVRVGDVGCGARRVCDVRVLVDGLVDYTKSVGSGSWG